MGDLAAGFSGQLLVHSFRESSLCVMFSFRQTERPSPCSQESGIFVFSGGRDYMGYSTIIWVQCALSETGIDSFQISEFSKLRKVIVYLKCLPF